ncbi:DUF6227 family protein [Streptomyces sp. NBC_00059]|uniref:DUF6227 family protein n=1 Tax=Streptomyces sp. NBC_00059 TaxID=2975635 RepID=UPI00225BD039|nr:DUF6227 family protein [Streptomyces sp. NBC_00059]MCX5411946.1 DUF6227 family protein [Streptomyces sp. NBC_00059]
MSDPYETTEQHLERLLRCALNSFDLSDTTVDRLGTALAHSSALHSSHHSAVLHRETYRHTYLLSDGTALTLWELVHGGGRDTVEPLRHELYDDEGDAQIAAARLDGSFWDTPAFGDDTLREDLEALTLLLSVPPVPLPRMYAPDNSADHARRVLRRAENGDRPGAAKAGLLRAAFAHHITQIFGRQCRVDGQDAGFTLYEHAFLLLDGSETSLWEVEHTATPDGRHMCEVYEDEHAARRAMENRSRIC